MGTSTQLNRLQTMLKSSIKCSIRKCGRRNFSDEDEAFDDAGSVISDAHKLVRLQQLNPEAAKRLESLLHQDPQTAFRVLALADSLINYDLASGDNSAFADDEISRDDMLLLDDDHSPPPPDAQTPDLMNATREDLLEHTPHIHQHTIVPQQVCASAWDARSEPVIRPNHRRCRPRSPWADLCLFSSIGCRNRFFKQSTTTVAIPPEPISALSSFGVGDPMASAASGGDFIPAALRADKTVLVPRERSMPNPPATPISKNHRNSSKIPECEDLNLKSPQPSARLVLPDKSTLRYYGRTETATEQASVPDELLAVA